MTDSESPESGGNPGPPLDQFDPDGPPLEPPPARPPDVFGEQWGNWEPAEFPKGFWRSVDYLLRHPYNVPESLRLEKDLWNLARLFVVISVIMAAIYGTMMGATNIIQGTEMALHYKLLQMLATSIKVPVLFLFTLVIVLFPIYVSNAFVGDSARP